MDLCTLTKADVPARWREVHIYWKRKSAGVAAEALSAATPADQQAESEVTALGERVTDVFIGIS